MIVGMRTLALVAISVCATYGCSCGEPTVEIAKDDAEIIFRGTITAFRPADKPSELGRMVQDTKRMAVFQVTRVWKGEVGQTFEMPAVEETTMCWGFWPPFLKVGTDLLVYARRFNGGTQFVTSICNRTQLAQNSKDFNELGPGQEPKRARSVGLVSK